MDAARAHVRVQVQDDKLVMSSWDGQPIAEAAAELCAVLSTSSCTELPCMVFVKPYYTQLRWNSLGEIEETKVNSGQLPQWCPTLFRPVERKSNDRVFFSPHLFGIDELVNDQLLGFDISRDLENLLNHGLLKFQTKHSQLTIAMCHEMRLEIQQCLREKKWVDYAVTAWRLCLHCVPDPFAEPLWLFHYELLRPVMTADVLPMLAILNNEKLEYLTVAADPLSPENPIIRAMYSYTSASVLDSVSLHNILSAAVLQNPHMSAERTAFDQLLGFMKLLTRIFNSIHEHVSSPTPIGLSTDLPLAVYEDLEVLLSRYPIHGRIAILHLSRDLDILGKASSAVHTRQLLSNFCIDSDRKRLETLESTSLNTIFEAGLSGDTRYLQERQFIDAQIGATSVLKMAQRLEVIELIGTTLAISFYHSSFRNFTAALPGLEFALDIFRQHLSPGLQLWSVVVCETMQCFNAIGYETYATNLMSQALLQIMKDHFVHHTAHTTPQMKLKCFDFRSLMAIDEFVSIPSPYTSKCHDCKVTKLSSYCQLCSQSRCLHCLSIRHGINTKTISTQNSNLSAQPSKKPWKHHAKTTQAGIQEMDNRVFSSLHICWIESNFEILSNFRIIAADSFVSQGRYDLAEEVLESVLTSHDNEDRESCHLAALRLSKVMRRQDTTSIDARYVEVAKTMSKSVDGLNAGIWSFWLDEVESIMNQSMTLSQGNTMSAALTEELLRTMSQAVLSADSNHDSQIRELNNRLLLIAERNETVTSSFRTSNEVFDVMVTGEFQSMSDSNFEISDKTFRAMSTKIASTGVGSTKIRAISTEWHLRSRLDFLEQDLMDVPSPKYIRKCVDKGDVKILSHFIKKGIKLDTKDSIGDTYLHIAARFGHGEVIKVLLDSGANIDWRDAKSCTPLHIAARYGDDGITKLLLDLGASVTLVDSEGYLPLHAACIGGDERTVNHLLSAGSSPYARTGNRSTTLHLAAEYGSDAVVRLLLQFWPALSLYDRDDNEQNPLHRAASVGYANILEILLSEWNLGGLGYLEHALRSVINAKDRKGRTPLQVAWELERRRDQAVMVLLAHGAKDTLIHKVRTRINKAQSVELKPDVRDVYRRNINSQKTADKIADSDEEMEPEAK